MMGRQIAGARVRVGLSCKVKPREIFGVLISDRRLHDDQRER